jgi:GT2 family glycosyltransferase/glycosyltransferase involved in cell wall biosynthesis
LIIKRTRPDSNTSADTANSPYSEDRVWTPITELSSFDTSCLSIGIAIINFNRRDALIQCVNRIQWHTELPYALVIADDGSSDGSSAWARESGIPVITGRRWGPARNKNRAISYLMAHTQCDVIILIEEDTYPCEDGWEKEWVSAAREYGQVNYTSNNVQRFQSYGRGTSINPYWGLVQSAQVTATRRDIIERFGYLDPRFGYWGEEHIEWSFRIFGKQEVTDAVLWPGLRCGFAESGLPSTYNEEAAKKSLALRKTMYDDPLYKRPYCDPTQHGSYIGEPEHTHELTRAHWPFMHSDPLNTQANLVSIICPTKNPVLARRLYESIGPGDNREFIWAWNGVGEIGVPGRVVRCDTETFLYEEAINRAAMASRGNLLWIVNDDVIVNTQDVPLKLIEMYQSHPSLGVAYANVSRTLRQGVIETGNLGFTTKYDPRAPHLDGCCWSIPTTCFRQMGGLEESLTDYGGDELVTAIRMKRLGYEGVIVPEWKASHSLHSTYGPNICTPAHLTQCGAALGWDFPRTSDGNIGVAYRQVIERELDFTPGEDAITPFEARKIAFIGTIGEPCGDSIYNEYLIPNLVQGFDDYRIYSRSDGALRVDYRRELAKVCRNWERNKTLSLLHEDILAFKPDVLHIIRQEDLMSEEDTRNLIDMAKDHGIRVVVTLHSVRDTGLACLYKADCLHVHTYLAKSRLLLHGFPSDKVIVAPHAHREGFAEGDKDGDTKGDKDGQNALSGRLDTTGGLVPSWHNKIPENALVIWTGGFLNRYKGHYRSVLAMPEVLKSVPNAFLVIHGSENAPGGDWHLESIDRIYSEIQRLGMENHVLFLKDFLSDEQMLIDMHCADVITMPYETDVELDRDGDSALAQFVLAVNTPFIVSNSRLLTNVFEYASSVISDVSELPSAIIDALPFLERERMETRRQNNLKRRSYRQYGWPAMSRIVRECYAL